MTNKTMDTVNTLLNSFHNNWHLPTLQLVNAVWRKKTPSALLDAVKHTEQAITALEHLNVSIERLMQSQASTITPEDAWRVANDLEELALSLKWITGELAELAIEIAEECALAWFYDNVNKKVTRYLDKYHITC